MFLRVHSKHHEYLLLQYNTNSSCTLLLLSNKAFGIKHVKYLIAFLSCMQLSRRKNRKLHLFGFCVLMIYCVLKIIHRKGPQQKRFSTAAAAGGRTSCRTSQNFAAIGALLYDALKTFCFTLHLFFPNTVCLFFYNQEYWLGRQWPSQEGLCTSGRCCLCLCITATGGCCCCVMTIKREQIWTKIH